MEVVIPVFALSSLYLINNQSSQKKTKQENFRNKLPNTDIPNRNYPSELPVTSETDQTSELSTVNKFDNGGGVYTDRFFNPNKGKEVNLASGINIQNAPITKSNEELQYYSLTGDRVDGTYFEHNNMVPFYGSKLYSQHTNSNVNESILDSYSGAGSQVIIKKEQAPLFAPHDSIQWAFGTPNQSEFIQSRINPSIRMANVNPFSEGTVAPGLGLGYTNEGSAGFNSGMLAREQWIDKTVDELRPGNKNRASGYSLLGYEGAANSVVKMNSTQEQMGVMEKHLPDQSFELGQDRYFTTTGVQKGELVRPEPVERYVSRPETTADYTGIAGGFMDSGYVPGQYMDPKTQSLGEFPMLPANANGRYYANDGDYGIKSSISYPNNRSSNHQESYYGLVSGGMGAAIAPLLDILRPSRKQNVIGTLRPYQNPTTSVKESYIFNPADRPVTTIRETTEDAKFHPNVNSNQIGGAYKVTDQQLTNTHRQETSDYYYAGNAAAGARTRQTSSYEAEYNQRNNNIKSSTNVGYTPQGNISLMNGDVNVRQVNRDELLSNNRSVAGNMPYQSPDIANFGVLNNNSNQLYSTIQMERQNNDTNDIKTMLKSNPFVVDYRSSL